MSAFQGKNASAVTVEQIDLNIQRTEHKVSAFLEQNSKLLLYIGLGIAALTILIFTLSSRGGATYTNAPSTFFAISKEAELLADQPKRIDSLSAALKIYPEMQARYDADIAQTLLSQGNGEAAESIVGRQTKRLETYAPSANSEYAKISLLIAQDKVGEALTEAKKLKEMLTGVNGSMMTATHLLRMASLERVAGTPEGELQAWQELSNYLEKAENYAIQETINTHFQSGKSGLGKYLEARKKELTKIVKK